MVFLRFLLMPIKSQWVLIYSDIYPDYQ
jgi:hypothetical protein